MTNAKFVVSKDTQGQHRFNLTAPNGEILLQSEAYRNQRDALDTINAIKKYAHTATTTIKE